MCRLNYLEGVDVVQDRMTEGQMLHAHYVTGISRDGEDETVVMLTSNDEATYQATGRPGHMVAAVLQESCERFARRLAACWNACRLIPVETLEGIVRDGLAFTPERAAQAEDEEESSDGALEGSMQVVILYGDAYMVRRGVLHFAQRGQIERLKDWTEIDWPGLAPDQRELAEKAVAALEALGADKVQR